MLNQFTLFLCVLIVRVTLDDSEDEFEESDVDEGEDNAEYENGQLENRPVTYEVSSDHFLMKTLTRNVTPKLNLNCDQMGKTLSETE